MLKTFEAVMMVKFSVKLMADCLRAAKLPWAMDNGNIVAASKDRVAEVVRRIDGQFICGVTTGAPAVSESVIKLAKLMAATSRHGWDSESGQRLTEIMVRFREMEDAGEMPHTQLGG